MSSQVSFMSVAMFVALGCNSAPEAPVVPIDSGPHTETTLPGHNDCLPEGQEMSDETCLAVIEESGRLPSNSQYKSYGDPPDPDWRIDDPDLAWLTAQTRRCTCSCCHQSSLGGPAVYHWDLDFGPPWIDSSSDWALGVFAGFTESDDQFLPIEDQERLQAVVQAELDRRHE